VVDKDEAKPAAGPVWRRAYDFGGTLILWAYFTAGFVLFFAPVYLAAWLFVRDTALAFQGLNRIFYKGFFRLLALLAPAQVWRIDQRIDAIRGAVVVCNHISYLDPLLLVAMLPRHTTVAKARLFRIPIFGRMLKLSGYIPATTEDGQGARVLERLDALPDELAAGGNLFVFPEGTRGRSGEVGPLRKGVFKLARSLRTPLHVLKVEGTDRLFFPGRFAFYLTRPNTIILRHLAVLSPEAVVNAGSAQALAEKVHRLMAQPVDATAVPTRVVSSDREDEGR
jgi:1-acyl-sn-glycerol-3-phosphate acyltransferase